MREYKIVVLGASGCGKSAFTVRFVQGEVYDPTIEDSYRKEMQIDGQQCVLEILDTAGTVSLLFLSMTLSTSAHFFLLFLLLSSNQEQFTATRDLYMKNGQTFILLYSITSKSSFDEVVTLREQLLRVKDVADLSEVPIILVGTNPELEDDRMVGKEQIQALVAKWEMPFFEVSVKSRAAVEEVYFTAVRLVNRNLALQEREEPARVARRAPFGG